MTASASAKAEFAKWYAAADAACAAIAGLGIDDLPDGNSWDAWESGCSPEAYAYERLEDEGFPFEEL